MSQFTINVEGDYLVALQAMARKHGITLEKEFARCAQFGISNLFYRMNHNITKNAETKKLKSNNQKMADKLAELGIDLDELL
jgi:hypothetical protein